MLPNARATGRIGNILPVVPNAFLCTFRFKARLIEVFAQGDVYHRIVDLENALLADLKERTLACSESLLKAVDFAVYVDCILSLAKVSTDLKLCRPTISNDPILEINKGRHLLQELTVETFVPNSVSMKTNSCEHSLHIIFGPNSSGKSVYIKQAAIITFLAHIGSFVPAESATVVREA
mgnify:CR=1 FL=1